MSYKMEDEKAVINTLQKIADSDFRYWIGANAENMIEILGIQETARSAIKLLRQNQTRTLTEREMDEQIQAYEGVAIFFIEEKWNGNLYSVCLRKNNPYRGDRNFFAVDKECYFVRSGINKYWRCWNRKPTEEQREETAWEERI